MKQLIIIITLILLASCAAPKLHIRQETKVLVDNHRVFAVITPANIAEAYGYMQQLDAKGYDCNEQKTECIGENVYICRVFDAKGQVYLIVNKR